MVLSGQLKDYSLPELLNTLQQGNKTGLLTIRYLNVSIKRHKHIHLYFKDGFLISLADDLIGRELLQVIDSNVSLGQPMIQSLMSMEENFQIRMPVGLYLESKNLVNELQLQKIFNDQVIKRAICLYELTNASFNFNSKIRPSMLELTGLKLHATKLNLLGLRALPCWDHLLDKFPEGSFTLYKRPSSHLEISLSEDLYIDDASSALNNLNPLENKVLQHADGKTSLNDIADSLSLPLLDIQKVAFQLIHTGYIDELPMVATISVPTPAMNTLSSVTAEIRPNPSPSGPPSPTVNHGFLQNLSSFLKGKILAKL
jgi:Domain of unknown function (DUF4388)